MFVNFKMMENRIKKLKMLDYKAMLLITEICEVRENVAEYWSYYTYHRYNYFWDKNSTEKIYKTFSRVLKTQNNYLGKLSKINLERRKLKLSKPFKNLKLL